MDLCFIKRNGKMKRQTSSLNVPKTSQNFSTSAVISAWKMSTQSMKNPMFDKKT